MADRYVYHGGDGTNSAAGWTNAYTTLMAAKNATAAGDRIFIAHDHNEPLSTAGATQSYTFTSSAASPVIIMCINRTAGNFPPLDTDITTMTNTFGGDATGTNISLGGWIYVRGLRIQSGSAINAGANIFLCNAAFQTQVYRDCEFILGTGYINTGNGNTTRVELNDCYLNVLGVPAFATGVQISGNLVWRNGTGTAALLGNPPSNLLGNNSTGVGELIGLNLSNMVGKLGLSGSNARYRYVNCSIGSGTVNAPYNAAGRYEMINCDSGGTNYRSEIYEYQGTLTTETGIVRSGGADNGEVAFSWKCVTNANNELTDPFDTFEGKLWNEDVGVSKTLTIYTLTNNVTLKNNEAWVEVEYPSSSTSPLYSNVNDGPASVLSTGTNQDSDTTSVWSSGSLATPIKQKLQVTFTPQARGLIRWRVKIAKTSTTVYVCPNAELS